MSKNLRKNEILDSKSFNNEKNFKRNFFSKKNTFNHFMKEVFVALIFFVLVLIIIVLLFLFLDQKEDSSKEIPFCGDGTFYGTCSLNKPYFCHKGVLVEKANFCGCPEGFYKNDNFCISEYFLEPIDLKFDYILRGQKDEIEFTAYKGVLNEISSFPMLLSYQEGEIPLRSDFKLKRINNELQRQAILPLIVRIQNLAPKNKVDQARIAISLVQSIPYNESENYFNFGKEKLAISKFPYEVLYDQSASCEGKSELLTLILKEIGYGVSLFYYSMENHEAVGIKCPIEHSLAGSGYCFVETTSRSILTDDKGNYFGVDSLFSNPEVIILFKGISLPEEIYEYSDANFYSRVREKNEINFFNIRRWEEIKEKYGLVNGK